jgi:hypothetical protein
VIAAHVFDERLVPLVDHRLEPTEIVRRDRFDRHDDVEPVRLSLDVRVHPFERLFELFDLRVPNGAEHAEPPRATDRGRNLR